MATGLARSLLQRTLGRPCLRPLASRLASGEAYVPEKPPVEGQTSEKVMGCRLFQPSLSIDQAIESENTSSETEVNSNYCSGETGVDSDRDLV